MGVVAPAAAAAGRAPPPALLLALLLAASLAASASAAVDCRVDARSGAGLLVLPFSTSSSSSSSSNASSSSLQQQPQQQPQQPPPLQLLVLDAGSLRYRGGSPIGSPAVADAGACEAQCALLPGCSAWSYCAARDGCGAGCAAWAQAHPKAAAPGPAARELNATLPLLGFGPYTTPYAGSGCQWSAAARASTDRWPFGMCALMRLQDPAAAATAAFVDDGQQQQQPLPLPPQQQVQQVQQQVQQAAASTPATAAAAPAPAPAAAAAAAGGGSSSSSNAGQQKQQPPQQQPPQPPQQQQQQQPAAALPPLSGSGWASGTLRVSRDCDGLAAGVCRACGASLDAAQCLRCARDGRAQYPPPRAVEYLLRGGHPAAAACAPCANLTGAPGAAQLQPQCFDCALAGRACATCATGAHMWGYGRPDVGACLACVARRGDAAAGGCNACAQSRDPARCFGCLDSLRGGVCPPGVLTGTRGCRAAGDPTACASCTNTALGASAFESCVRCNADPSASCAACGLSSAPPGGSGGAGAGAGLAEQQQARCWAEAAARRDRRP